MQVGYGDITPTNDAEKKYALVALLLGALVFGFMLSSIGSLVAALDRQAALSEERMDEVKEYMRWCKMPRDLMLRMNKYYLYYYQRKTIFDEQSILGNLSPGLRFEVIEHRLKDTIGKIPLFASTLDPLFQMEVFPLLTPLSATPKEVVFNKGDASQSLYFLIKGNVEVISGVDGRVLYRIRAGSFFGESVLTGRRRAATHRAADTCEMLCISSDDLTKLFNKHPRAGKIIFHAVLHEHVRKERMRNLSLRLLVNQLDRPIPGETADQSYKRKLTAAAVRLQCAWNKACDKTIFNATDFDADEKVDDHAGRGNGPLLAEESSLGSPTPQMSMRKGKTPSLVDNAKLADKLDRLERYLGPLLQKLDEFERKGGPNSGSNRKK